MIKKILVILLISNILLISGCNEKENKLQSIVEIDGVIYELNSSYDAYIVTASTNNISEHIILANSIESLPVTKIEDEAFRYSVSVLKVTISKNIKEIGNFAFADCLLLEEVNFVNGSLLEIIGENAFENCKMLESIVLPDKLREIKKHAFYNAERLHSVSVPNSIELTGGGAFVGCNLSYNIFDDVYYLGNKENPYVLLLSCEKNEYFDFVVPEGTKIIGKSAFEKQYVQKITFPKSLYNIDNYAFTYCPVLEEIIIPINVEIMGKNVFDPTAKLKNIYLEASEIPSTFDPLWNEGCKANIVLNYKPTN